jgi:DNA-binding transcriptional LysR family regulator
MQRSDLSDLEAFAAIARHRSFRRAATERGVSPSALSHVMRGLEERLGVRLLSRTSRSVAPTEAGERLLTRLAPALSDIAEALDEVNSFRDTPVGTLRLNVPRSAARRLLAPMLARFLAAHPRARLEIVTDDGLVDIVERGFDAGIRVGQRLARDMIAVPFGPSRRFAVVGSPAYLTVRGLPSTPHDLQAHACIDRRYPSGASFPWGFERDGQVIEVAVDGPLVVDDADLMVRAALDGVGLAFVYEDLVLDLIDQGLLMRVLEDWCPAFPGFFLYYPSRRQMPAVLRAFIDAMRTG